MQDTRILGRLIAVVMLLTMGTLASGAQAQGLLHQSTEGATPVPLPAELAAKLADPFFLSVLQSNPNETRLERVLDLVQPDKTKRQLFIVGEHIGETSQSGCSVSRRTVISFSGTQPQTGLILDSNVFVSTFLSPRGLVGDLEVIGWDETHSTYNFYRLDAAGSPNGGPTWKLRNMSAELHTATPADLAQSCLRCHVNGVPVMKEFSFPWNNWHSFKFRARYLLRGQTPPANEWPAASSPLLRDQIGEAQTLERIVQSSIGRFVDSEIKRHLQLNADGTVTVTAIPQLMDSLFKPTELNLASSTDPSGLDGGPLTQRTTQNMQIPDSFFLNITMMKDLGLPVLAEQGAVPQVFAAGNLGITLAEYEQLLTEFRVDVPCLSGHDTIFAWFGPEVSEFDRRMVDRLKVQGFLDPTLIAAVLAVDVEKPMFSPDRERLLRHLPESLDRIAPETKALRLRQHIVSSLEATAETDRTEAEKDFLKLLTSNDTLANLNARVTAYRDRIRAELAPGNATQRAATLTALFRQLLSNRNQFRTLEISRHLIESPSLLPLPN